MEGGGFVSYLGLDKLHTGSIDYRATEVLLRDTSKVNPIESQIWVQYSKENLVNQQKLLKRSNQKSGTKQKKKKVEGKAHEKRPGLFYLTATKMEASQFCLYSRRITISWSV